MTVFPWPVSEAGEGWDFEAQLPFPPDDFQLQAFRALKAGHSVLVSAPTGSGKTLVAAYAVHRALQAGGKAFYTTPLKALSNQKYGDLVATYGPEHVGLLTGDTAVRPEAPVVVMTTEVLRNMLLAGSDLLGDLHTVILDEVHFIQDPYRGGVWEEVLVLSPPEIRFVCLSATVNNAKELGEWLRSVRGDTDVIVERHRPIVLRHLFAAHRREDDATLLVPLLANGKAGGEGQRIDQAVRRASQGRPAGWQPRGRGPRLPYRSPLRTELIAALDDEDLLPAIVFIFSRAACDDAVHQVVRDGVRLTDRDERATIRQIAEARVESLSDEDLGVLGYDDWLEGLSAGVAAHHAGLVPVFRETVEECFAAGLLRVVFATETLSLGINMPARTVVIERFTKYGGAGRASLTSGEYLQLTGRAGPARPRRGGPCRRGLVPRDHLQRGGPRGHGPASRSALVLPPDVQPGRQPGLPLRSGHRQRGPPPLLRPMAGATGRPPLTPAEPSGGRARGVALRRGLVAHGQWPPTGPHLPRVRSPDGRGAGQRAPRRDRARHPGRRASPRWCSNHGAPGAWPGTGAADHRSDVIAVEGRWPTGWARNGWPICAGAVMRWR